MGVLQSLIRFHHGTDQASADDLRQNGVNFQKAASWNGSGEFWATTDHRRAEWFAHSHPSSPPAACFEFSLSEQILIGILTVTPPGARRHGANDYEFLPSSYVLLNQMMMNKQIIAVQ